MFTKFFTDTPIPLHEFIIIPQSWTLSIEIIFYLMAPFIARKNLIFIFFLFMVSLSIKVLLWMFGFSNGSWQYRFVLSELSFFFIGIIVYKFYKIDI